MIALFFLLIFKVDVYDGPDNKPQIFHQKTLTSKIYFEDALIACKEAAFVLTDYPLIITIELHCSSEGQKDMAQIIKKHIDGKKKKKNTLSIQ